MLDELILFCKGDFRSEVFFRVVLKAVAHVTFGAIPT